MISTSVRERPILFSGAMIRAILADTKIQTRRAMKNPPAYPGTTKFVFETHPFAPSALEGTPAEGMAIGPQRKVWLYEDWCGNVVGIQGDCPYGEPGDRLWCRETFFPTAGLQDEPRFAAAPPVIYRADYEYQEPERSVIGGHNWKPSIFMRRSESRITLEITEVRVERLNDISEEDAKAEGVADCHGFGDGSARTAYEMLWESINGPGSWAKNPFVWAISFKRVP